jgi:hypothetical protein
VQAILTALLRLGRGEAYQKGSQLWRAKICQVSRSCGGDPEGEVDPGRKKWCACTSIPGTMDDLDDFEGEEEVDYDFNLDDDFEEGEGLLLLRTFTAN